MKFYRNIYQSSKNEITHLYVENGIRKREVIPFQPIRGYISPKESEWKDIYGNNLSVTRFPSIVECNQWERENKDLFDIYGSINHSIAFIAENYPSEILYDRKYFKIFALDIECYVEGTGFPKASNPANYVNAVTFLDMNTSHYYTFSLKDYVSDDSTKHYYKCKSEEDLLEQVIDFINRMDVDILTGWNIASFDIPYLIDRVTMLLGEDTAKKFSPNRKISKDTKTVNKREVVVYKLMGISVLDYLDLYQKYTFDNRESFTLDYISKYELGKEKLEYKEEFGDLNSLYNKDFEKFIVYNIRDVELIKLLDLKLKFIDIAIGYSYGMKCTLESIYTTITPWDALLYFELYSQKVLASPNKHTGTEDFLGGYVKEPIKGFHEWVTVYDIVSSYPNQIIQSNIGNDTILSEHEINKHPELVDIRNKFGTVESCLDIEKLSTISPILKKYNLTYTCNGQFFRKDKVSFIGKIIKSIFDSRLEVKKQIKQVKQSNDKTMLDYLESLSLIIKIKINSLYGSLSNEYFRYFDLRLGSAVTHQGQLCARGFANYVVKNNKNITWVYQDTDSGFFGLEQTVQERYKGKFPDDETIIKFILKYQEKIIEPSINEYLQKLYDSLNVLYHAISVEHECIANKSILVEKKKYVMSQLYKEGEWFLDKPKLKIKGIEIVRTSTPQVVRDSLKKSLDLIFTTNNETLIKFIEDTKKEFYKMSFEQIASPRGVKFSEYHIKSQSLPIQVRAAFVFNEALKKMKLDEKYKSIGDGSKIKFCYIKEPNIFKSNVIGCLDKIPTELLAKFQIDYDTQWEKTFLNPITKILDTIGWKVQKNYSSLSEFF